MLGSILTLINIKIIFILNTLTNHYLYLLIGSSVKLLKIFNYICGFWKSEHWQYIGARKSTGAITERFASYSVSLINYSFYLLHYIILWYI